MWIKRFQFNQRENIKLLSSGGWRGTEREKKNATNHKWRLETLGLLMLLVNGKCKIKLRFRYKFISSSSYWIAMPRWCRTLRLLCTLILRLLSCRSFCWWCVMMLAEEHLKMQLLVVAQNEIRRPRLSFDRQSVEDKFFYFRSTFLGNRNRTGGSGTAMIISLHPRDYYWTNHTVVRDNSLVNKCGWKE